MSVNRRDYSDELVEGGFAIEVADAPLLHEGLNLADIAHVLVLHESGIAPDAAVAQLLGVLLDAQATPVGEFGYDPEYGETYNWRERRFTDAIGDAAGWLHAGRTRREAVRVALRLRLRRDVVDLIEAAARFVEAAAVLAAAHAETYMADQTYLQQAQPSTFGHYVLQFCYAVQRDVERLVADLAWINRSPGGVGCVNGSSLPYDRARIAELLGFDDVIEHTRDAMWQNDGLLTLVADAAGLVTTLAKLAEDLEIWSSKEFDYVELAEGHTRGSVMMPQKRNPYALSMVRGEAGVLIGRLTGLYAVAKTPSARSDNLIFAYGEVPRSTQLATKATRLMAGVVGGLRVNSVAMYRALETGYSQATDIAEFVMLAAEVDYRTAYDVVGATVRRAAREGVPGVAITGEMLDAAATEVRGRPLGLAGRDLTAVLDPATIVRTRATRGGAAPEVVRGMARECLAVAREAVAAAQARRAAFVAAEDRLLAAAAAGAGVDGHRRVPVES
ncbi:argininosuccinate lyase [Pseudonocardia sp.]|uniref:argininosuccinate lyase n=1 Tax=Pseudonocardia sp. TaxID=60912 RepID=UPI003D0C0E35